MTQAQIAAKINDLRDELIKSGVNIPFALKRRDPNEPGRTQKEKFEDQVFNVFMQQFRKQRKHVKDLLTRTFPGRKAIDDASYILGQLGEGFFVSDAMVARLVKLLTAAFKHGIILFGESQTFQLDYVLTNARASKWASEYTFDLIKGINGTTRKALRTILKSFVDTPGMTIGDVVTLLPFDESRALMIATTEITRVYSEADELAAIELKAQFPDVRIIITWWTNFDDRVCILCGPLHGMEIEFGEGFTTEETEEGVNGPPLHVGCRCWRSTTTRIVEQ